MIRQLFHLIRDKLHNLAKFGKRQPPQVSEVHQTHQPPQPVATRSPRRRKKTQTSVVPIPPTPQWTLEQFPVPPLPDRQRFHDFELPLSLMHAIADEGFSYCTPIQAESLPHTLAGKDLVGQAQTGTGKTAAFLITIINRILHHPHSGRRAPGTPRALILAPTRELVLQIVKDADVLTRHTHMRVVQVFGGTDYRKQQALLLDTVDILVATPGRLLDFQQQKLVDLGQVEILVLDEADRMLDMGFIPDVRSIVRSTPQKGKRQTLLFSATFTAEIKRLVEQWTQEPQLITIEPDQVAAQNVEQLVYIVTNEQKYLLLYNLITQQDLRCVMIFANRRDQARDLNDLLRQDGIRSALLSGEVPQDKRIRTLDEFRAGKIRVLVATDVAGRGIHVDGVSHVINYTLPDDPQDYVHRIGRTGRAGMLGTSVSFASEDDAFQIPALQEFLGIPLPCVQPEAKLLQAPDRVLSTKPTRSPRPHTSGGQERQRNHSSNPGAQRGPRKPRRTDTRTNPGNPE